MKKMIAMILLVATLLVTLVACGSFKCQSCYRESKGKKHTISLGGEKITCCDDCYQTLGALGDLLGGLD